MAEVISVVLAAHVAALVVVLVASVAVVLVASVAVVQVDSDEDVLWEWKKQKRSETAPFFVCIKLRQLRI